MGTMDTLTHQGKLCKIYKRNKYRYQYEMKKTFESCGRCTTRGCNVRIYVSHVDDVIRESSGAHLHTDTVRNASLTVLRAKCKVAAATQQFTIRPAATLRSELAKCEVAASLQAQDLVKCKKAIYRVRRKRKLGNPAAAVGVPDIALCCVIEWFRDLSSHVITSFSRQTLFHFFLHCFFRK